MPSFLQLCILASILKVAAAQYNVTAWVTLTLGQSYTTPALSTNDKGTFILAVMEKLEISQAGRIVVSRVTALNANPPVVQVVFYVSGYTAEAAGTASARLYTCIGDNTFQAALQVRQLDVTVARQTGTYSTDVVSAVQVSPTPATTSPNPEPSGSNLSGNNPSTLTPAATPSPSPAPMKSSAAPSAAYLCWQAMFAAGSALLLLAATHHC